MNGNSSAQPSFDPSSHLKDQIFQEELGINKGMDMDTKSSHPKVARNWVPGKCIPRVSMAPGYVINLIRVGAQT
jgi:hypothetical protein